MQLFWTSQVQPKFKDWGVALSNFSIAMSAHMLPAMITSVCNMGVQVSLWWAAKSSGYMIRKGKAGSYGFSVSQNCCRPLIRKDKRFKAVKNNEFMKFLDKWMDLEEIILSKLSSFNPVVETQLLSSEMCVTKASLPMLSPTGSPQEVEVGKTLQGKCFKIICTESPAKFYCCYGVIVVLTVAVIALSVALSAIKTEQITIKNTYAACPQNWFGVGNKCFYFSKYTSNWTFAQNFCMAQEAQLARFDNEEELKFLMRFKGNVDCWIGLHRESSEHPWKWTDNTEYNNTIPIRGEERYAYLNNNQISSTRIYSLRMWICSKLNSYSLHCQTTFFPS